MSKSRPQSKAKNHNMLYQKIRPATTNGKAPKIAQFPRFPDPRQGTDLNYHPRSLDVLPPHERLLHKALFL
jgi:hypothetical protein